MYICDPIHPTKTFSYISAYIDDNPQNAMLLLRRIFDTDSIDNQSAAGKGIMGYFNKKESKKRNKQFYSTRKIYHPVRDHKEHIILAEGDSWFQFPSLFGITLTKDIISHLLDNRKILVKSLASAGDWLSNMLHGMNYIEQLPKLNPSALLVSGGGNDLVDEDKIATMIDTADIAGKYKGLEKIKEELYQLRAGARDFNEEHYKDGSKHILPEFFDFINLIFVQFYLFMNNLSHVRKYENMLMITHGYDFCFPRLKSKKAGLRQWFWEKRVGGKWLSLPMAIKGISSPISQRNVVYFMIHEYNEMMISLAIKFKNVYHLDCRGLASSEEDWLDELHLKSHGYRQIAQSIEDLLDDTNDLRKRKIITVARKAYTCQI